MNIGFHLTCLLFHTVCPRGEHYCLESSPDSPVCISELEVCDTAPDCPEGSDESQEVCVTPPGDWITTLFYFLLYVLIYIFLPLKNVHILEQYDWYLAMRQTLMREEWRFAMEDSGGLCVMTFGVDQMLK